MLKKTMQIGEAVKALVTSAPGDLRVTGWELDEISAKTDGDALDILLDGDALTIACDGDLILNLPRRLSLDIEAVSGDVDVRDLPGGFSIREIEGDLSLRMVGAASVGDVTGDMEARESGPLTVDSIQADLSVRGGKGDLFVRSVQGDVSLHEIQGNVNLESVIDDLYVRGVTGNLKARVEEDAVLYLQPTDNQAIDIQAEGDILLHMSAHASAALTLSATDADDIRVEMPGVPKRDATNPRSLVLGNGGAAINLKAEGDVMVTSRESDWESAAEFDFGGGWPLPDDFSERINHRVQEATRRAQRHAEAAERRLAHRHPRVNMKVGRWNWDLSPRGGAVPPSDPVTDEERMTILRMLQDKKITSEDAEKLLSALEGGG